ncbi:MAG: cytidine/deoxycytidylate deaminase family protein [Candidatus Moranbacteria bacterium]|nr:cytidine/deoxycytidylate deaminase family protein [Candidatus Moranbacteria bacterium]
MAKKALKKKNKKSEEKYIRPSWDEYFLDLVEAVGKRATCDRGRTSCIIVREKRILSTGYVGSPIGAKHCDDAGHEIHTVIQEDGTQSRHCIRTSHAEQNAIANAARFGMPLEGGTLYAHMAPCYTCAKMIINSGIKRVVCRVDYHGAKRAKEIFKECGIEFEQIEDKMQTYKDM